MLGFKQFVIGDGNNRKVVSISNSFTESIDEINNELDSCLTECLVNPYIGWVNASKILTPYGIHLPKAIFEDLHEGVEVIALNINELVEEHYFYYEYNFVNEGYQTFASIVNETELEKLLEE